MGGWHISRPVNKKKNLIKLIFLFKYSPIIRHERRPLSVVWKLKLTRMNTALLFYVSILLAALNNSWTSGRFLKWCGWGFVFTLIFIINKKQETNISFIDPLTFLFISLSVRCSLASLTPSLPVSVSVTPHSVSPACIKNRLVKLFTPSLFHLCVWVGIFLDQNYRNVSQTNIFLPQEFSMTVGLVWLV